MYRDFPVKSQLTSLKALWTEAFGDSEEFIESFFSSAFDYDRCLCAVINEEIAGVLYWFDCLYNEKKTAYIYSVATSKAYRGRGICHKLTEYTHNYLKNKGYSGAILVPGSKELFGFYEGMGYKTSCCVKEFSCSAGEEVSVCQIDKYEYSQLRRKLLPCRSVIQENENIDFLNTYAEFYKGDGFLLAADKENDILSGIEFLGDEKKAPGIIPVLGCKTGNFRTFGNEKPFAMFYPLADDFGELPEYFGLAFD